MGHRMGQYPGIEWIPTGALIRELFRRFPGVLVYIRDHPNKGLCDRKIIAKGEADLSTSDMCNECCEAMDSLEDFGDLVTPDRIHEVPDILDSKNPNGL